MIEFLEKAKKAKKEIAMLNTQVKNDILLEMADALIEECNYIIEHNEKDMSEAILSNLSKDIIDRLLLTGERIVDMSNALKEIAQLKEPLGRILDGWSVPNGLNIQKVSIPIGVIAIIYESRPNVTSDVAALCFKSGNVCILKGGKEAKHTNQAIAKILRNILEKNNISKEAISLIPNSNREAVASLIVQDKYLDLIIPRGGEELIKFVNKNASVPVIKHDKGLCHIYLDKDANHNKAMTIAINAKCQRPGVCNAMETLLIHKDVAAYLLPPLHEKFIKEKTQIKACEKTRKYIDVLLATEEDYHTEYLANILNIKVVENINEAIEHINTYGSGHSESIISENYSSINKFLDEVDSACVYANASTRFTDGSAFGFGAEVGISTNKLHARGPMGVNDLTTFKYKIYGNGQIK